MLKVMDRMLGEGWLATGILTICLVAGVGILKEGLLMGIFIGLGASLLILAIYGLVAGALYYCFWEVMTPPQ